jgi:hypothetical protein
MNLILKILINLKKNIYQKLIKNWNFLYIYYNKIEKINIFISKTISYIYQLVKKIYHKKTRV